MSTKMIGKPIFLACCIICMSFSAGAKDDISRLSIEELQQRAEELLDRNMDSSRKLLEIASSKIPDIEDENLKEKYLADNRVMRAYLINGYIYPVKKDSLARLALKYFKKVEDQYGMGKAYMIIAINEYAKGCIPEALEYNQKALKYVLPTDDHSLLSRIYYNNDIYLQESGQFEKALASVHACIKHAKKAGDSLSLLSAHVALGKLNAHFRNLDKAEYHYDKAMGYSSYALEPVLRSMIMESYASILFSNGFEEKSAEVYEKALAQIVNRDKICGTLRLYTCIGKALTGAGKWEKAEDYFKKTKDIASEYGVSTSLYFLYLAKIHALMENKDKALEYLNIFLKQKDNDEVYIINEGYHKEVAFIYKTIGETNKALEHYEKWTSAVDSIYDFRSQVQLADIENRYQREKEKNIEIEKQKADLSLSKNRQLWLGAILLLSITGGGSSIYYLRLRSHKEKEKLKLQMKENHLNQILVAQEEERKRLARELHDGVGQSLAALKMQLQMAANNKASSETVHSLDVLCKEVRSLSHQMMPLALQENGLKGALEWLVDQTFANSDIKADLVVHISENRMNNLLEVHLYRIAQELFNNTLKHSKATEIGIQLLQRQENIFLIIEDNGQGFSMEQKQSGIGLANIHSRLDSLSGKMEIQSSRGEGTFVRIVIPLVSRNKMIA